MEVESKELGIRGTCDVVEFHETPDGIELFGRKGKFLPLPVEYKRGRPKANNADALQLCAQAMCLEEMLCVKSRRDICSTVIPSTGKRWPLPRSFAMMWIEMDHKWMVLMLVPVAPHVGAWIEINQYSCCVWSADVAPHVGAWIEIQRK